METGGGVLEFNAPEILQNLGAAFSSDTQSGCFATLLTSSWQTVCRLLSCHKPIIKLFVVLRCFHDVPSGLKMLCALCGFCNLNMLNSEWSYAPPFPFFCTEDPVLLTSSHICISVDAAGYKLTTDKCAESFATPRCRLVDYGRHVLCDFGWGPSCCMGKNSVITPADTCRKVFNIR